MSTRKTTLFYAVLIAVASLAVGMVIASRLDLTPASSAQTHRGAADEQRAAHRRRSTRRPFRNIAKAQSPMVVNIRTEMKAEAQDLTDFFGGGGGGAPDDFFHRFFGSPGGRPGRSGAGAARPRQRPRRPAPARADDASPRAPGSSSARTASSSPTTTSSRTRPRSRCRSTATTPTSATRRS